MLLAEAGEDELLKVFTIVFLVFAYPNNAILNDVGHNIFAYLFDFLLL